jgi:hypothetical protein
MLLLKMTSLKASKSIDSTIFAANNNKWELKQHL